MALPDVVVCAVIEVKSRGVGEVEAADQDGLVIGLHVGR